MELRKGTEDWEEVAKQFAHTFEFIDEQPTIDAAFQMIKEKIFVEILVDEENFHYLLESFTQHAHLIWSIWPC